MMRCCMQPVERERSAIYFMFILAPPATAIVISVLMSSVACFSADAALSMMCGSFSATAASAIHLVCWRWSTPGESSARNLSA
jgi:hypothetical protein